jgi:hypothetical protein
VLAKNSGSDFDTKWADPSAVPDASPTVKGIVQLAGDLTGTAASPQIAAGAVTDAEVATATKDGAAATPSMRTLGTGANQAAAGNDPRFASSTLLGVSTFTADVTTAGSPSEAAPQTIVSLPSLTFDGSTLVRLEFFTTLASWGSTSTVGVSLWDDSPADQGRIWGPAAAWGGGIYAVRDFTPAAGTRVYRVRAWGANGAIFRGGAGGAGAYLPGFIRARVLR